MSQLSLFEELCYSLSSIFMDLKTLVLTLEKAMAAHSSTLAWKNPMNGGGWEAAVHAVMKSQTGLSGFTFTFHFHALEKAMATHSSVLAWRISGTEEPGRLLSLGSHRVRYDWSDLAAAAFHFASQVAQGYEVLPPPPYSPDLSSTNYHFFKHLDYFCREMHPPSARGWKCFPRVHQVLKHECLFMLMCGKTNKIL